MTVPTQSATRGATGDLTDRGQVTAPGVTRPSDGIVADPNVAQVAVHWPGQYSVVDEGLGRPTVVPTLSWRPLLAGASGIVAIGRNDAHPDEYVSAARTDDERRGATWIDPWKIPYLKSWDVRSERGVEGKLWGTIHSTLKAVPGRRSVRLGVDDASLNRWRRQLMDDGVVPRPAAEHLDALVGAAAREVDRVRALREMNAELRAERVAEAQAELERVQLAVANERARQQTGSYPVEVDAQAGDPDGELEAADSGETGTTAPKRGRSRAKQTTDTEEAT